MILPTKRSLSKITNTLLVTGASSEMGSALIRQLLNNSDLKIRAMVHRSLVNVSGCEIRPGNLKNKGLLVRALSGVDTVVHMAALTKSTRESDYFEVNVSGTKNLIDACLESGVKKIIYISSVAVSSDGGGYALSKLEAENCIKKSGLNTLYVDGVKNISEEKGPGFHVSNQTAMTIGGHPGGAAHAFAGALDDMAIFTRVITEAEINTIIKGWAVEPAEKLAITWAQLKHL